MLTQAHGYRFEQEELCGFDDGGAYAAECIDAYKQQLAVLTGHIDNARHMCTDAIGAINAQAQEGAEAALKAVLAEVPAHKQDLEIVEAVSKSMLDARRCIAMGVPHTLSQACVGLTALGCP